MYTLKIFIQYLKKYRFKKTQSFTQIFLSTIATLIFVGMLINIRNKYKEIEHLTNMHNIKGNITVDQNAYNQSPEKIELIINNFRKEMQGYKNTFDFCQFSLMSGSNEPYQLYIDYNLNSNIKFPLSEGRSFNKKDFEITSNDEPIPILISKKLAERYPINTTITLRQTAFTNEQNYENGGAKFKVIAILGDEGEFWITDQILLDRLNYFEVIIFPIDFCKLNLDSSYLLEFKGNSEFEQYNQIKNSVSNKFKELKLVDSSLETKFKEKLRDRIIELIFIGGFTFVLLLLSLFGFIAIIQGSLIYRRKELGIYYALGGTPTSILKMVILDIWIMCFISMALCYGIGFIFKQYIQLKYEILLDKETFIISTGVILIYTFIATIFPSIKILKENPVDLLRN